MLSLKTRSVKFYTADGEIVVRLPYRQTVLIEAPPAVRILRDGIWQLADAEARRQETDTPSERKDTP